jgi:hypothetical protein
MRKAVAVLAIFALAVAILLFWHFILLALVGLLAWRILMGKNKRGGGFAKNLQAVAVVYAAWNSRWLKPATKATIRAPKAAPDNWQHDLPPGY